MDLKHLRSLSTVIGAGSFSKAAAVLGVSQPLLSRYIQELEREFGTQLLHRNGRGILPTDAGSLLIARATGIIEQADALSAEMHTFAENLKGRVVVSFPPSIGSVLTLPLLKRCREAYPEIAVQVVEGYGGHIIEWLSTGRSDIGILYNVPDKSIFTIDLLAHEDLMLVAAAARRGDFPDAPVAARQLCELEGSKSRLLGGRALSARPEAVDDVTLGFATQFRCRVGRRYCAAADDAAATRVSQASRRML